LRRLRFIFAVITALGAFCVAQDNTVPAGGKWTKSEMEEKMTGNKRIKFSLPADNYLRDSEARPEVMLFCVNGKLKLADFHPHLRMAGPNRASFWGRPQMHVMVRVDKHHDWKNWNWVNGDFLAMDDDTAKQLIGAQVFKVQFGSNEGAQIAEFSPGGLDLGMVRQACGVKPQKP
jgi:hypothetical protein